VLLAAGLALSLLCLGSAVRSDDSIFFIKSPPESQRVREGDTVSLDCEVNDVHDVTYSWRKGGDDLDSSARLLVAGNRMVIHSVAREDDSKGYSCLATKGSSRWVIESPLAFINILCECAYARFSVVRSASSRACSASLASFLTLRQSTRYRSQICLVGRSGSEGRVVSRSPN